jgi:hypothetical protein
MSTTKTKTKRGYVEPETPQGTEGVIVTPTFTDIVASGGVSASPARVGNRQYANNTGSEVVPEGGEGTVVESGGGTTASPTPMPYEQWWYNRTLNRINQDAQTAKDLANIGYEKSKSEYGSRAAALESMGLTGSGYSDYLTGQAYAQKQSAIAAADAQKAESMFDLDTKYMEYLDQKRLEDEQKTNTQNSNYASTLSSITADTTDEWINQIGATLGFSKEQIQSLKKQRNQLKTDNDKLKFTNFLSGMTHTVTDDQIDELARAYGWITTDEKGVETSNDYGNDYVNALKAARANRVKEYLSTLDLEDIDKELLDALFPNGADDENYGSIYKSYIDKIVEDFNNAGSSIAYDDDGKLKPKSEVEAVIKGIEDLGGVVDKDAILKPYTKEEAGASKVTYNPDAGLRITNDLSEDEYGEKGQKLVLESGTDTYKVEFSGKEFEEARHAAQSAGLGKEDVFIYKGKLYILLENDDDAYEYSEKDKWQNKQAGRHLFAYELEAKGNGDKAKGFYNNLVAKVTPVKEDK